MNGNSSLEDVALAISVSEICYGQSGNVPLTLGQIHSALSQVPHADIDAMLQRLNEHKLIRLGIAGGDVHGTTCTATPPR
jgi:hypothetical protein